VLRYERQGRSIIIYSDILGEADYVILVDCRWPGDASTARPLSLIAFVHMGMNALANEVECVTGGSVPGRSGLG
jgi:hypothetical protein